VLLCALSFPYISACFKFQIIFSKRLFKFRLDRLSTRESSCLMIGRSHVERRRTRRVVGVDLEIFANSWDLIRSIIS